MCPGHWCSRQKLGQPANSGEASAGRLPLASRQAVRKDVRWIAEQVRNLQAGITTESQECRSVGQSQSSHGIGATTRKLSGHHFQTYRIRVHTRCNVLGVHISAIKMDEAVGLAKTISSKATRGTSA